MGKQIINPSTMPAPAGYSYAVKKSGTPLYISGQVAIDGSGKLVGEGDAAAQTEQVFANLRSIVEAAGGTLADIVKLTIYVTDAAYRPAIVAARNKYFTGGEPPASTYLVISGLALPQLLVEIEAIAVVG
ncbi:MAG: RidA family protein [Deltaproteobacteria bacterium]|nr:RidA family protein [Deltaproteobacteria bacterium]